MKRIIPYGITVFFVMIFLASFSQVAGQIDSLQRILNNAKEDTVKVELLNALAASYLNRNAQQAVFYANKSHDLALQLHDKAGVARALNNLGMAYENMGKYDIAMQKYFESLKIKEEIGNIPGLVSTYNNIGLIYDIEGNFDEALLYYQKSHDVALKVKDESGLANATLNIGVIHMEKGENELAVCCFRKSLALAQKIQNRKCELNAINNIGLYYQYTGKPDSALLQYDLAIQIARSTADSLNLASAFNNTAVVLFNKGDLKSAITALNRAVAAAISVDAKPNLKNYYENLAELYDTLKDYKHAYYYHKLYAGLRDTLQNAEKLKRIAELQFAYDTEKKNKELEIIEKEKEVRREAEKNKQKLLILYLVAGVVLILLILLFLYGRFRLVKKQKIMIEEKNELVESKNKEITDSIFYARRIQRALLASDSLLQQHLPEYFVLNKPKDIVSGDFYWATMMRSESSDKESFCLAVADCTGHGVPGAFMSLLNISFLNQAVIEKKLSSPELVLDHVRTQIISALNPLGSGEETRDGMDAILCVFDFKGMWLRFSAANNPLWLIRNNELKEFGADKMPVGMYHGEQKPFSKQTLGLRKGDMIYLFTDGYADQFGGPKGKKFKYKKLQELLLEHHAKPVEEQRTILDATIEEWRSGLEQVDDILVVGIRV